MANIEERKKLLVNLKKRIKSAESKGYIFNEDFKSTLDELTLKELREISRANKLYLKSKYVNPETGESETGSKHFTQSRTKKYKSAKKVLVTKASAKYYPKAEKIIMQRTIDDLYKVGLVDKVVEKIKAFQNEANEILGLSNLNNKFRYSVQIKSETYSQLLSLLTQALSDETTADTVAQSLEENATEWNEALQKLYIDSKAEDVIADRSRLIALINGRPLTMEESKQLHNDITQYEGFVLDDMMDF